LSSSESSDHRLLEHNPKKVQAGMTKEPGQKIGPP